MAQDEISPDRSDTALPADRVRRISPDERDLSYEPTPEEVVALVGHEIKGPLAIVGSLTELLSTDEGQLTETRKAEVLRTINRAVRALSNTVATMLQLGALGDARVPVDLVSRDVGELLEATRGELSELIHPHALELRVDPGLPGVQVDAARFRQVLFNLVSNAAQFSSESSPVEIRVERDRRAEEGVTIKIRDHGIGIPAEHRELVFQKFTKLGAHSGGLGIGLFVCRALVTSMNGHIWVEPAEGPGAVVCVALGPGGA